MEGKTFREAYDVLQGHATTLREQDEPNIDDLLEIVNESVAAYKVCKERIDAVEKALEQALVGAGLEGSMRTSKPGTNSVPSTEVPAPRRPTTKPGGENVDDLEDDIPF